MALLKTVSLLGCSQLNLNANGELGSKNCGLSLNFNTSDSYSQRLRKWECCALLAQRTITAVEDEKKPSAAVELGPKNDQISSNESTGLHRDLNFLPKTFLIGVYIETAKQLKAILHISPFQTQVLQCTTFQTPPSHHSKNSPFEGSRLMWRIKMVSNNMMSPRKLIQGCKPYMAQRKSNENRAVDGLGMRGSFESTFLLSALNNSSLFRNGNNISPDPLTCAFIAGPLSANDLSNLRNDGTLVRVAYQGVPGAYSEAAALKAYPKCETVPCDQFEDTFKAVELWLVDRAVLPIENSLGGSIHCNYDLLLRHRLHIVGEVQMAVNHCLLGLPGVKKEDLKHVLSHPQALAQCEMTLSKYGIGRINADDTAGAAQTVASDGQGDIGAIASARAATIYGLDIIEEGIQDDPDNVTRFLVLAREPIIPGAGRPYRTSIVFTLEEGPGVLFKALAVFSLRGINLIKIESRPQRKLPLRVVDGSNLGSAK
ncbi:Prephenate dehydratase [Dillenia turbinata]|uniref:arogenate dehydratase n=1 Tax=Dillenia turbinata TaxID=194707 RepID=A0AAN8UQR4_9MAGN